MIEDNLKEEWRNYNTSREFSKDLKFNRKWYHLIAIFDKDQGEEFDFNSDVEPGEEFDFNQVLEPTIYNSEDFVDTDEIEFDFNSPLMEKYKITEIGLIMNDLNEARLNNSIVNLSTPRYNIDNITDNSNFKNFYNAVNNIKTKGFYVKTGLMVFSNDFVQTDEENNLIPNTVITDETKFKDPALAKNIFSTILKAGGGYTNEATIELLGNIYKNNSKVKHESYADRNIILLLSSLNIINHINSHNFPDAVFDIKPNDIIPVDLKVAYSNDLEQEDNESNNAELNHKINISSENNVYYMSKIYKILCDIINNNKKTNLIEYIRETTYSLVDNKLKNNNNIYAPELKGFLLFSLTAYNPKRKQLDFSGLCMRSIISCMHGRNNLENDCLFASKSGRGQGAISYDNGIDKEFGEKGSILYGCPERFASVIKNFYKNLVENTNTQYGDLRMFLDSDITSSDTFEKNLNIIYKAIDPTWEFNFNEKNLTEE